MSIAVSASYIARLKETIASVQSNRREETAKHKEQMETLLCHLDAKKANAHSVPTTAPTGTGAGKGGGCACEFEAHVRRLSSTGVGAVAVRDCTLMNAEFLLSPEELKKVVVPDVRWTQKQREAMGSESWLHGMMKMCRAEEVLQFGFDGTMIRRQSTMNQWALIEETKDSPLEVVSIETAGTLVGGTVCMSARHFRRHLNKANSKFKKIQI